MYLCLLASYRTTNAPLPAACPTAGAVRFSQNLADAKRSKATTYDYMKSTLLLGLLVYCWLRDSEDGC